MGDRIRDWIASKSSPDYADRVMAPFRAVNDYFAEPAARGVDTIMHPGQHTGAELAGGALDASGAIPAGLAAKGAGMLKSMFLMPTLVQKLQDAGRIKEGAKGSLEALDKAEEVWNRAKLAGSPAEADALNRQAWSEHGWAPGNVFGNTRDNRHLSPVSWYNMPDIEYVDPRSVVSGTPLNQSVRGLDDIGIAAPEVAKMPFEAIVDPTLSSREIGGAVRANEQYRHFPPDARLRASGQTKEQMDALLRHEIQHGLRVAEDSGNIDFPGIQMTAPSVAMDKLTALRDRNNVEMMRLHDLRSAFPVKSAAREPYARGIEDISRKQESVRDYQDNAPRLTSYLDTPHEREARATSLAYRTGLNKDMPYPADIDVYDDASAWPVTLPSWMGNEGIRLRDYQVKK